MTEWKAVGVNVPSNREPHQTQNSRENLSTPDDDTRIYYVL